MTEYTIEVARPVIAARSKQFEAALMDNPAAGKIRPVSFQPWMAAVMADFQKQPQLCAAAAQAPETVWECLSVAAGVGLVPGSAAGKFYLIPRWSGKQQRTECTFIIGYKGLAELAYRHPRVHMVEAFVVYEGEPFEFDPGAGKLLHKWRGDVDRSDEKIVAAFSKVSLTVPGGTHVDEKPLVCVMTIDEIKKIRDRSAAAKKGFSPWTTDFAAMVRKTPMRRHMNGGSVPQSSDLIIALSSENHQEQRLTAEDASTAVERVSGSLRAAVGLKPVEGLSGDPIDKDFDEAIRHADDQA